MAQTEKDLGPLIMVKFVNIESPGVDIRFNYQGKDYGPLSDGEVYELPREVVKHLNGLSTPRLEYRIDPATGQARSAMTGRLNRFALQEA
ncbi:MAG: hypothetical protein HZB23_08840 [Deltaproteobacteria bacterium]|nr:hypothetical protein [Deltaproteobacteria bacterium]